MIRILFISIVIFIIINISFINCFAQQDDRYVGRSIDTTIIDSNLNQIVSMFGNGFIKSFVIGSGSMVLAKLSSKQKYYWLFAFEIGECIGSTYGVYSSGKKNRRTGSLKSTILGSTIGCVLSAPMIGYAYSLGRKNKEANGNTQSQSIENENYSSSMALAFAGILLPTLGSMAGYLLSEKKYKKNDMMENHDINQLYQNRINFYASPTVSKNYVGFSFQVVM